MLEILGFTKYVILQSFGVFIIIGAIAVFMFLILRRLHCMKDALLLFFVLFGIFLFSFLPQGLPSTLQYPFSTSTFGPGDGPVLPFKNVLGFFGNIDKFERIENIAQNPTAIPAPITRKEPSTVKVTLEAKEVISEIAPGITYNYWTYDSAVPGPFIRVRKGDTVELTLKNHPSSLHTHNIDLHAVTGPGGGAVLTNVAPGESKTMTFKALNPGLFVYHCAHPNVPTHMTHGMYGLILVEPEEGLSKVDKEFYVMQGELYATGALGKRGLQIFDGKAMLDSKAQYIIFNGKVESLTNGEMTAQVGETVRIFAGNGGVNFISSFHVIGEIFDRVYTEAAIGSQKSENVQTTLIPAGGASIVEFDLEVPGNYVLVDHALARLDRGAWGILSVFGEENPQVFRGEDDADNHDHNNHAH